MKKSIYINLLLTSLLLACGTNEEEMEVQTYEVLVQDAFNNPKEGIEVYIGHSIGSTYPLDQDQGITNASGIVELQTEVNSDTVQAILERESWTDEFYFQSIGIESSKYFVNSIEQNGSDKSAPRRKLDLEGQIQVYILEPAQINLAYEDPNGLQDVTYAQIEITGLIGNQSYFTKADLPISLITGGSSGYTVASNTDLTLHYTLYEGEFLQGNQLKEDSLSFRLETGANSTLTMIR